MNEKTLFEHLLKVTEQLWPSRSFCTDAALKPECFVNYPDGSALQTKYFSTQAIQLVL